MRVKRASSRPKGLGLKIGKWFTVFGAVIVIVAAFTIGLNGTRALRLQSTRYLLSVANAKADQVEQWYGEQELQIEILAQSLFLGDTGVALLNAPQKQRRGSDEYVAITRMLQKRLEVTPSFLALSYIGTDGQVLASSDETQVGKTRAHMPFFQEGLDDTYLQNVYHSLTRGQPAVTVASPVNAAGEVIGVLAADVDLSGLTAVIAPYDSMGKSGDTYMVNRYNFFVTDPRYGAGYAMTTATHTEGVNNCLSGQTGTAIYDNYAGTEVVGGYAWSSRREVGIIAEMSIEEAFGAANDLVRSVVLISIAMVVGAIGLSLAITRRITPPIQTIVDGANILAEGNLEHRIELDSGLELGRIARSINTMADRLRQDRAELAEARDAALESSRATSMFVANVSHELRTPLTSIIGFGELLQKQYYGPLNEKQQGYTADVLDSARHLLKLINQLLDFERTGRAADALKPVKTSVRQLIDESLVLMGDAAEAKGVTVRTSLPERDSTVVADTSRISQVLVNLLSNGIRFTPPGGSVTLGFSRRGHHARFSVEDTGIGMSKRELERVFEPFYQASVDSGKHEGVGLGLPLSRRIVERHGGKLWAESDGPGKGSRVVFVLPLNGQPASRA